MGALAGPFKGKKFSEDPIVEWLNAPMKGGVIGYQGGIAVRGSDGFYRPGRVATGDVAVGRWGQPYYGGAWDNTGNVAPGAGGGTGADGGLLARIEAGIFLWDNSAGSDAISDTQRDQDAWIVDDHTVALTDGGGTRSYAGKIVCMSYGAVGQVVESNKVYIQMAPWLRPQPIVTFTFPIVLAALTANAQVAVRWTPGFPGRLRHVQAVVVNPATAGGKGITIAPSVAGGAAPSGNIGQVVLTSANMTPIGAKVVNTADYAAGATGCDFLQGDEVTFVTSALGAAFTEGEAVLQVQVQGKAS